MDDFIHTDMIDPHLSDHMAHLIHYYSSISGIRNILCYKRTKQNRKLHSGFRKQTDCDVKNNK